MYRLRITIVLVLLAQIAMSQNSVNSPYSYFGIGDLSYGGLPFNTAMGGVGIAYRSSEHINPMNPASYTGMDSLSFIFEVGAKMKRSQYSNNGLVSSRNDAALNNIIMGFPVGKNWATSLGLVPYSSSSFNISNAVFQPDVGIVDNSYTSTGGINSLFWGNSFEYKNLSLGVNIVYMFGSINKSSTTYLSSVANAASIHKETQLNAHDVMFNMGFQYKKPLKNDYYVTLGATYSMDSEISSSLWKYATRNYNINGSQFKDTIYGPSEEAGYFDIPAKYGVGIAFGKEHKLHAEVNYTQQDWTNAKFFGSNDSLGTARMLSVGVEYTPDYKSLTGYHKHVRYRAGAYVSDSYVKLGGSQVKDYGMTFGIGLPLKSSRSLSQFDLSVNCGRRGSVENGRIVENYIIFAVGFKLHDLWFYKPKIQ